MKKWDQAIIAFDEAFRIRVDKLPQDHKDISEYFHLIGKAYKGDGKLDQALEYFKKAQRIFHVMLWIQTLRLLTYFLISPM